MTDDVTAGDVVWAPGPLRSDSGNPRPWLVISTDRLPYAAEESIDVAFTTQSHHSRSVAVPSEAWVRGEPRRRSHVLPWTVATLKHDLHDVGRQGTVTDGFTQQVRRATISYLEPSDAPGIEPTLR